MPRLWNTIKLSLDWPRVSSLVLLFKNMLIIRWQHCPTERGEGRRPYAVAKLFVLGSRRSADCHPKFSKAEHIAMGARHVRVQKLENESHGLKGESAMDPWPTFGGKVNSSSDVY